MFPYYHIFNLTFASYGTLILIGLIFGGVVSYLLAKKYMPEIKLDVFLSFLFGALGVAIGGKLLYIIVSFPQIIQFLNSTSNTLQALQIIISSGFVFYGSLIGAILALFIYCKSFHVSIERILYFLTPAIPLIQVFGRIGCFSVGCCYGVESESFGYVFKRSPIAPNGVRLFPTQLLESIACFIIFVIILILFHKIHNGYRLISIYGILYSTFRFFIEFFRGDIYRGFIRIFSISQIISLLLLLVTIIYLLKSKNHLVIKPND